MGQPGSPQADPRWQPFSAPDAGGGAAAARTGRGEREAVRRYDFHVPDKFPKDVLRQVALLYEAMARTLTTTLSAQLRSAVRVEQPVAEQRTYQEFVRGCSDPAILAAFGAEPLAGSALVEIDPVIGFPIIDRLLGGSGDTDFGIHRPLTEIETTVVHRVLRLVLENWRDSWSHVAVLRPAILAVETNPLFVQLAAPHDIMLAVTLTCGLGRREGRLRFCVPHTMLEPVLRRLMARQWHASAAEASGTRQRELEQGLGRVRVPVQVQIAGCRLPLRRLVNLREGEVLPLGVPANAPARVIVSGRTKFTARVGVQGAQLAVEIAGHGEE